MDPADRQDDVCSACGRQEVCHRHVESTRINLCGECGVEYQVVWRPARSPIEPNVVRFVNEMGRILHARRA